NHAVRNAFEEMIAPENHPLYILFLDIDPEKIDINVHPTKQEIKFEDERLIYNYLRVSVRHALGKYSVTPSLDFERERAFERSAVPAHHMTTPQDAQDKQNMQHWEKLFDGLRPADTGGQTLTLQSDAFPAETSTPVDHDLQSNAPYQVHNTLLISQIKSGIILVDQQAAHERILFERNLRALREGKPHTQKSLFPITVEFNAAEAAIFKELLPELKILGFEIEEFGGETFVVQGVPAQLDGQSEEQVLRHMLAQYQADLKVTAEANERIAKAMSLSMAIPRGKPVPPTERQLLIDMLFACENPYTSPSGRKCFVVLELDELLKRFN
ncbi:MAG: DNA mismatch repair protein MutL, partial [Saprospiraceae bacterium]|nr:DNA mismatch repair protein MutL [Saprospiraceae bacterium]